MLMMYLAQVVAVLVIIIRLKSMNFSPDSDVGERQNGVGSVAEFCSAPEPVCISLSIVSSLTACLHLLVFQSFSLLNPHL